MSYTQTELLNSNFSFSGQGMFDGILKPDIYVLAGSSKTGKSILATTMANSIASGEPFLNKKMVQGKVIYFDNDNYDFETKDRLKALNMTDTDSIIYEFDKSKSIWDISKYLKGMSNIKEFRLVIIDSYIGLDEINSSDDSYKEIYPIIKELRDLMIELNLICFILHHTKKGKENFEQDNMLGSKALSGATTGTFLLKVKNEFDNVGELRIILRNHKEIIPIHKDMNSPEWKIDNQIERISSDIDTNILKIINTVVGSKENTIQGTCQELTKLCFLDINPNYLFKFLKQNEYVLSENHVSFSQIRTSKKRIISIVYCPDDSMTVDL